VAAATIGAAAMATVITVRDMRVRSFEGRSFRTIGIPSVRVSVVSVRGPIGPLD
jgi:hypothetical protein